ncbi:MAG: serine hydrolase [Anaerolineaceae bacterium]|nr:serine hydrolase [Anaerolineaceae bacterium]
MSIRRLSAFVIFTLLVGPFVLYAQDTSQTPFPDEVNTALHNTLVGMLVPDDRLNTLFHYSPEVIQADDPTYKPTYYYAPGAVLYVQSPEGLFFEGIGVGDVTTRQPLDRMARYEIGSTTKTMTAAVILQLQEEGKLSVDDHFGKYLPELAAIVPNADKITIDQLLTHTGGIFDYLNNPEIEKALSTDIKALEREWKPEEIVRFAVENGQPVFTPGEEGQWSYSNTGYILLGLIIEKVSGKSYTENLQTRIFDALNMKDTYVAEGIPHDDRMVSGYLKGPFDFNTTTWNGSQAWSAGAVISTAPDMAVYIRALVRGELFKQPSTLDTMMKSSGGGRELIDVFYARGLENYTPGGIWGHAGQSLGFNSVAVYIPATDTTIITWGNSSEAGADFVPRVVANILGYSGTPSN